MKKIFILLFVLILIALASFSVLAYYYPEAGDFTEPPSYSLFGTGTTNPVTLLNDGFAYDRMDMRLTSAIKGISYQNSYPYNQLGKFVRFTHADSGVQFSWSEPQLVNQIELFVWRLGAINEYEIQISENDVDWETIKTGAFDQTVAVPADNVSVCAYGYLLRFENVQTKNLRFVIKSFRDPIAGAYLSEITPYNTVSPNLLYLPLILVTDYPEFTDPNGDGNTEDQLTVAQLNAFSRYVTKFDASNSFGGGSSKYGYGIESYNLSGRSWPAYSTGTRSGCYVVPSDPVDPNNPEDIGVCWYAVDFGAVRRRVNRLEFNITLGTVYEYEILYSNHPDAWENKGNKDYWETLETVGGEFTGEFYINLDNAPEALCYYINFTNFTKGKENLRWSDLKMYEWYPTDENDPSTVASKAVSRVFDGVTDEAVVTCDLSLPNTLEIDGRSYGIEWSCDSALVDTSTGIVTRPAQNETFNLTAKLTNAELLGANYRITQRKYTVLAADTQVWTQIAAEDFQSGEADEIFSSVFGNVTVASGTAQIGAQSSASVSAGLTHGFYIEGRRVLELDFKESGAQGTVSLQKSDGASILDIQLENGKIRISYDRVTFEKEYTGDLKLKLEISGGSFFNLYTDNGTGYRMYLYNGKISDGYLLDRITFAASQGQGLTLDRVEISAVREDIFNSVKNQFDFSKISDDTPMNITKDLSLIDNIFDVAITYESTSPTVVNPETGAVDTSVPCSLIFTAHGSNGDSSFTKEFTLMTGWNNLMAGINLISNASFMPGNDLKYANDNIMETSFITTSKFGYRITADFKENTYFNETALWEAETQYKISGFTISVSNDNVNYTEVYIGTGIENGKVIDLGLQNARYLRLNVTEFTGEQTGVTEWQCYSRISAEEKLKEDFRILTTDLHIENGTLIPKTGFFGAVITVFSDNDAVTVAQSGENWLITVASADAETTAAVTVTAQSGNYTESKAFSVLVPEKGAKRSGTNLSSGAKSSETSRQGAVSYIADIPAKAPAETGNNADALYSEISGHWGEKEIKMMLDSGVVKGDGNSLSLERTVSRAEFVTMLIRAFSYEIQTYKNYFADVDEDAWYADYAQTALYYGLMSGDGAYFRGEAQISRQEMATVLMNIYKQKAEIQISSNEPAFTDFAEIAGWAQENVGLAAELGLITGYENGEFLPFNGLKRDESIVVIYRLLELVTNNS